MAIQGLDPTDDQDQGGAAGAGAGGPRPATAPAPVQSADQTSLADRWGSWLDKPGNRAALLQFGVSMLQPMQPGENWLGHAANAVAYGGEAEQRVHQEDESDLNAAAQRNLRGSQADAAEARAGAAGSAADAKRSSAELALERLHTTQAIADSRSREQYFRDYEKEIQGHALDPGYVAPDFETWAEQNGINLHGASAPQGGTTPQAPPAAQPAKMSTADFLSKYSNYTRSMEAQARGNPKAAQRAIQQNIEGMISDPENLYHHFGLEPPR